MGIVYLVGAGPGNPGLITVNGLEALKKCDVVVYDRLASSQLLDYVKKDCIRVSVGKESGYHSKTQAEINEILVHYAKKHNRVVRLKGGDPFVFGRGGEEVEELIKEGIPYELIPGISSSIAVPELAGIPVTHRGLSRGFHVMTGHTSDTSDTLAENFETLARLEETLVFLMGLSNLEQITERLLFYGKDPKTPVAVIANGTTEDEKTVRGTLETICHRVKEEGITSPAVIVIGKTAALCYQSPSVRVLAGLKFGVTSTMEIRQKLNVLSEHGARLLQLCTLKVSRTSQFESYIKELRLINNYSWIFFTSQNAIKLTFEALREGGIDHRELSHIKFAVVGKGTGSVLEEYGYLPDFIPENPNATALFEQMSHILKKTDRVLIPSAVRGTRQYYKFLDKKNISYSEFSIYDVKGIHHNDNINIEDLDCLIFTSKSGVEDYFKDKSSDVRKIRKYACLGEVTANEIIKYNPQAEIVVKAGSTGELTEEIFRIYRK